MRAYQGGASARFIAALACALLTAAPGTARAITDSERIEAVSEFLLDRAQANYLYIFEQRMKNNDTVRCYFPTVYSRIRDYDLRLFLKTREDWGDSIEKDLGNLARSAAAKAIAAKVDLRAIALQGTNRYVEIAQYVEVEHKGKRLPLHVMDTSSSAEERAVVNGFYQFITLRDLLLTVDQAIRATGPCGLPALSSADIANFVREAKVALSDLQAWRRHIDSQAANLRLNTAKLDADCRVEKGRPPVCAALDRMRTGLQPFVDELKAAGGEMQKVIDANRDLPGRLERFEDELKAAKTKTRKVQLAIELLQETAPSLHDEIAESLKKYALFFAEISDAQNTEEVKAVLTAYTLPAVSFGLKREKYKGRATISAFLGYAYGAVLNDNETLNDDNNHGVYAPLGLDLSLGTSWGGSFSLMVAPFDFGYPVSLKLNGVKEDLKLEDIVAPSIVLAYGKARYPLTGGLVYQWGRKDPASNIAERRLMLFLGFDMPLFSLF
jgi:hypothetical protein